MESRLFANRLANRAVVVLPQDFNTAEGDKGMTKKLMIAGTLLLAIVSAGIAATHIADEPKIDGKWSGQVPRPNRSYDSVFEFKVEGEKLTGKVYALDTEFDIVGGKVKGDTISFRIGTTQGNYSGKVSGDQINCEVNLSGGEFGSRKMAFKLARVKE